MTHPSLSGHILLRGDHISQVRWVADWCAGLVKILAAQKGVAAEREVCHEYPSSAVPIVGSRYADFKIIATDGQFLKTVRQVSCM